MSNPDLPDELAAQLIALQLEGWSVTHQLEPGIWGPTYITRVAKFGGPSYGTGYGYGPTPAAATRMCLQNLTRHASAYSPAN